ncbi:MAG TPA: aminotransferase class IV [Paenibacillus sp.]
MSYIGFNGAIVEQKEAVISVLDHGFLYGLSLFETFRTYDGRPFLLSQHLERLAAGCRALGIELPRDCEPARVERLVAELLQASGLRDGYVRYTVTAGDAALGLPDAPYTTPNVVVYVKALPAALSGAPQGKALQLLRTRRNSPEGDVRLKSAHYMNNILAKRELGESPVARAEHPVPAEGLMLTAAGHVAEGIVSNVFFASKGVLCTPVIDTGILPGVTRALVLELAKQKGIRTEEGYYTWEDLVESDEVFITNSIQEIVPIHTLYDVDGTCIAKHRSDAVSTTPSIVEPLQQAYRRFIAQQGKAGQ